MFGYANAGPNILYPEIWLAYWKLSINPMDEIIEITCSSCTKVNGNHKVQFTDGNKVKYEMTLHASIPLGANIRLNTYHHDLSPNEDVVRISVKQPYLVQPPTLLEMKTIIVEEVQGGYLITYQEITTQEKFRMKAAQLTDKVGVKRLINFTESQLEIHRKPHYHIGYTIENWIFNKRLEIEELLV